MTTHNPNNDQYAHLLPSVGVHSENKSQTTVLVVLPNNQIARIPLSDFYNSLAPDGLVVSPHSDLDIYETVALAYSRQAYVYWAAGEHEVNTTIEHLHEVIHRGPGVIKRGSYLFYPEPNEAKGHINTLYLDPNGQDSNDGLSPDCAIASMAKLNQILKTYCQGGLAGRWRVYLAPGSYDRLALDSSLRSDYAVEIFGPAAGHPNIPTAIIDGQNTSGRGVDMSDGSRLRLTDILITNFPSGTAMVCNRAMLGLINVHVQNCLNAVTNLHGGFVSAKGGIWDGNLLGGDGYESFYNATHELSQDSNDPLTDALVIRRFGRGMLANEGAQGHVDGVNIEDCAIAGINFKRGCGAWNTNGLVVKRNAIGVLSENNAWFDNNIVFGTGVDANVENVRLVGSAPELSYLTEENRASTLRRVQFTGLSTHTGSTAKTQMFGSNPVPVWAYSALSGPVHVIHMFGAFALPSVGTCTVRVEISDGDSTVLCAQIVMPAGTTVFDISVHTEKDSANTHHCVGRALINNQTPLVVYRTFGFNLINKVSFINVFAQLSNAADSFVRKISLTTNLAG